jgi:hypothetical protein
MSPAGSANTPEARARVEIDRQLETADWTVQHRDEMNLSAGSAVAIRKFKLRKGQRFVDYMLFLDGRAVGVCEAKPAGFPVRSVEVQAQRYVEGLPATPDDKRKFTELYGVQRLTSILKWAFEGKLVDQDPNDEPAEVLLARIKAERVERASTNSAPPA